MKLSIACADVGSISAGNFGWAICDPPAQLVVVPDHASIDALAKAVSERLIEGRPVALGFECPLFVPIAEQPANLSRARKGEGNRPWSASAGAQVLAIGIPQVNWLLARIRGLVGGPTQATMNWAEFLEGRAALFLWEAFVSREAKAKSHHDDAALAVAAFTRALPNPTEKSLIPASSAQFLSLVGAALLWTGWTKDVRLLAQPCAVISA